MPEKGPLLQLLSGNFQGPSMTLKENALGLEGGLHPREKHFLVFPSRDAAQDHLITFANHRRLFLLILSTAGIRHEEPRAVSFPETRN